MTVVSWVSSVASWTGACCHSVNHLAACIVAASPNTRVPWRRRRRRRRLGRSSTA